MSAAERIVRESAVERIVREFEAAHQDMLAITVYSRFVASEALEQKAKAAYAERRRELLELLTR